MNAGRIGSILLALAVAHCGGSGGDDDGDGGGDQAEATGCAPFCHACPSDFFGSVDCDDFCAGWTELSGVSSCQTQWQAGWTCVEEAGRCIEHTVCETYDGGGGCSTSLLGECEPPGDSLSNCVEAYCRDHETECEAITTAHGIPW